MATFGLGMYGPARSAPTNTAENESLPSLVENFVTHFFGTLTKTSPSDGVVDWTLPADLAAAEPIPGLARLPGEGIASYIIRACQTIFPGPEGRSAVTYVVDPFVQPAVGLTVMVYIPDNAYINFAPGQYVWIQGGGFYQVTAMATDSMTVRNLYSTPHNVVPGTTIAMNSLIAPSGVPEAAGPVGPAGTNGTNGVSSYVYVAYATSDTGASFSNTPFAGATYMAVKRTDTALPSPLVGDFEGLWVRFRGVDGSEGNGPEPTRTWEWKNVGTHKWLCPALPSGVTQARVRVTGGGGGGGGGGATGFGRGGGGGEYASFIIELANGNTYTISVGGGGTGGADTVGGAAGSSSSITLPDASVLSAAGGGGGGATSAGALGTGGTGGTGSAELRVAGNPGGNGVTGYETSGGDAGRQGTGGLQDVAGGSPGGGGGGASAVAGTGANGAIGSVRIDFIPA